jgi:alcohol dehydrogenase class IV
VIETNVQALKERSPASPTLDKFDEVARILTNSSDVKASDAVIWIQELCDELNLPALSEFWVTESDISAIVSQSKNASSMKGNPIDLTEDELARILQKALQ